MPGGGNDYLRTPSQPSHAYHSTEYRKPLKPVDLGSMGLPPVASVTKSMQLAAQQVNADNCVDVNGVMYSAMKFIGRGGSCKVHQVTTIENAYISWKLCGTSSNVQRSAVRTALFLREHNDNKVFLVPN
jgi:hypothetical protein